MLFKRQFSVVWIVMLMVVFIVGCKKKAPPPPPPPPPQVEKPVTPPPPKAPVIGDFTAEPSSIERGQSSTLRWAVTGATSIAVNQGIGTVQPNASRRVFPSETTTYELTASGPGGTVTRNATVNVTAPPPPPPPPPEPKATLEQRLAADVSDAYFDYDKSDIREDARATLTKNADALKAILGDFPNAAVVMEGHCDDRGSAEYNLGLGDRRATSAKEFLVQLGVASDRLRTISYGKERPVCTEANEGCWQKNRRVHFSTGQ